MKKVVLLLSLSVGANGFCRPSLTDFLGCNTAYEVSLAKKDIIKDILERDSLARFQDLAEQIEKANQDMTAEQKNNVVDLLTDLRIEADRKDDGRRLRYTAIGAAAGAATGAVVGALIPTGESDDMGFAGLRQLFNGGAGLVVGAGVGSATGLAISWMGSNAVQEEVDSIKTDLE